MRFVTDLAAPLLCVPFGFSETYFPRFSLLITYMLLQENLLMYL